MRFKFLCLFLFFAAITSIVVYADNYTAGIGAGTNLGGTLTTDNIVVHDGTVIVADTLVTNSVYTDMTLSSWNTGADLSAGGFVTLTATNTLEIYVKDVTDATNCEITTGQFIMKRIQ